MISWQSLVLCALGVLLPAWSHAVGGIDLSVNGCPGNPGASGGYISIDGARGEGPNIDCASGESIVLLGTWAPAEAIPDLIEFYGEIHVQVSGGIDLNPLWDFGPGACNQWGLASSHRRPITGCDASVSYTDVWSTSGTSGLGYTRQGSGGKMFFACFRATPIAVAAGQRLFGMQILIDVSIATEAGGTCAGCCSEVELLWRFARPSSAAGTLLTDLASPTLNFPGFTNGIAMRGTGAACGPVPAHARSWGSLKSLYR